MCRSLPSVIYFPKRTERRIRNAEAMCSFKTESLKDLCVVAKSVSTKASRQGKATHLRQCIHTRALLAGESAQTYDMHSTSNVGVADATWQRTIRRQQCQRGNHTVPPGSDTLQQQQCSDEGAVYGT